MIWLVTHFNLAGYTLQFDFIYEEKFHYTILLHTCSVRAVRYWGAILKVVLNVRDTDRTSYLRHDLAIAYEMACPCFLCSKNKL